MQPHLEKQEAEINRQRISRCACTPVDEAKKALFTGKLGKMIDTSKQSHIPVFWLLFASLEFWKRLQTLLTAKLQNKILHDMWICFGAYNVHTSTRTSEAC